jgi:hypothetical protein
MSAHDIEQQARWEKLYSPTCAILLGLFLIKLDEPRISSDTLREECDSRTQTAVLTSTSVHKKTLLEDDCKYSWKISTQLTNPPAS